MNKSFLPKVYYYQCDNLTALGTQTNSPSYRATYSTKSFKKKKQFNNTAYCIRRPYVKGRNGCCAHATNCMTTRSDFHRNCGLSSFK